MIVKYNPFGGSLKVRYLRLSQLLEHSVVTPVAKHLITHFIIETWQSFRILLQ